MDCFACARNDGLGIPCAKAVDPARRAEHSADAAIGWDQNWARRARRGGVLRPRDAGERGSEKRLDLAFTVPPLQLETVGFDFSLQALNARGEVLIAFLGDILREPCVVISERDATRLAGHIVRGAAPVDEDQRTRRASVMSLVRDLVAALAANDDPLLGLFRAFAHDLVFQLEDLVQKRAREKDQRG